MPQARLTVRLFGNGRLLVDDAELSLPSRANTLPLAAYLLFHVGESLARKHVAFTLWPDETEDAALQNLRRNLHRLLRALPPAPPEVPWLLLGGRTIGWNPAADFSLDVAEFKTLRADGATLERAVALYTGDLLCERYDQWITVERERLRRAYLSDLAALVATSRSRRDFASALRYARLLHDSDPWHEDAVRALMAVRYESGDAAGALADFNEFARKLRAEMSVEPMPETLALRAAISRGEALASALGTSQTATHGAEPTPFVGRNVELERLRDRWLAATRGAGGLAFLRGEAGIGKSRLASELALAVEGSGGRVLAGTTSSPERDPYQCLSVALGSALPLLATIAVPLPLLAAIAELVPEVRSYRSGIPPIVRLDPASDGTRLIDALAETFGRLAGPRPLLLVLEDLHRAGSATVEAIASLAPRLARSRILVVATYRTSEADRNHPLRSLLRATERDAEHVTLGPLGEADVRQLVNEIADAEALPEAILASIVTRSEGNPLFVTELLRDRGRLEAGVVAVPSSVKAMIDQRVASLGSATRTVAEISATVGEAFAVELVRELAGLRETELLDGLDELLDRHLVRESTERGRFDYAFTHHLIHATVYDGMPAGARTRRHRRIARILDVPATHGEDERSGEIAFHYERGDDPQNAASHYVRAAHRAARLNANAEARDLVGRALALDTMDDERHFELALLRSRMNLRLLDGPAEAADLDVMESIAERLGTDAACATLVRRIDRAFRDGDAAAEAAAIERLAERAEGNARWSAAADEARSKREQRVGEYREAIEHALRARDEYAASGDPAACARVTAFAAATCASVPERFNEAESLAAEALELADRSGDVEVRMYALRQAAYIAREISRDLARSVQHCERALAIALEIGDRGAEALCRINLGYTLWRSWNVDDTLHHFREAMRLSDFPGMASRQRLASAALSSVLGDLGDYSTAIELCTRSAHASLEANAIANAVVMYCNVADMQWQTADVRALERTIATASPLANTLPPSRTRTHFLTARGRLHRCKREYDCALAVLEESFRDHDRGGRVEAASEVLDEIAVTELARKRVETARLAFDRGVAMSGELPENVPYPIRHHWIHACILRAAKERDASQAALERAHDIFTRRDSTIRDRHLRASFAAVPVHAAVRLARDRDEWPEPDAACVVAYARNGESPARF